MVHTQWQQMPAQLLLLLDSIRLTNATFAIRLWGSLSHSAFLLLVSVLFAYHQGLFSSPMIVEGPSFTPTYVCMYEA